MLADRLAAMTAERDELRATLDNERGEGVPPSSSWERNDVDFARYGPSWCGGGGPPVNIGDGHLVPRYTLWVLRDPVGDRFADPPPGPTAKEVALEAEVTRLRQRLADVAGVTE